MACEEHKNPLQHSGTSQKERSSDALKPAYAKVDDRDYADWIVFANEFGRFLNYFDETNTIKNDWTPFFTNDISSILGSVAIQNIDDYREQIKERFDFLKNDDNKADIAGLETKLNELFSGLLTLSKAMDEYYAKLPDNITLKITLLNLIQTKLAPALYRLIGYYKAAPKANLTMPPDFAGWRILNKALTDADKIINSTGLSPYWIINSSDNWSTYASDAKLPADNSIFISPLGADEYLKIEHAANHNLFSGIFDQYLFAFTKIVNDAGIELNKTLENRDTHQPHYALFLSFLKLFKLAQQHINNITKEHLDFYYKSILHLKPKPAEPDHVHIVVELAKQIDSYLLKQQTAFKAGKDSKGKEVIYALDNDTTFNKAKAALLKSIYIASNQDSIPDPLTPSNPPLQDNTNRLFASPVANSADGLGAPLTSANKDWHPYVHKIYEEGLLKEIAMPKAQIGFAVASHYLYLTEGERKVYIRLVLNDNPALLGKSIECYLTTEKAWFKVESAITITTSKLNDGTTDCATISFTLEGDKPAIVNYNAAVHGGTYNCLVPILKIILVQDDVVPFQYDFLKDLIVTKAEVRVVVGMDFNDGIYQKGLKNLSLSNNSGPIDASKPFMPFGAQPKKDAIFVIGNKEVFSKRNSVIKLVIEWANLPAYQDINYNTVYNFTSSGGDFPTYSYTSDNNITPYYPTVQPQFLKSGIWENKNDDNSTIGESEIFNLNHVIVIVFATPQNIPASGTVDYEQEYSSLNTNTKNGYLRLVLKGEFGHNKYQDDLVTYLLEKNYRSYELKAVPFKPTEPYAPTIQSLYLSYSAYQTTDLNSIREDDFNRREIQLFHIYPFGEAEQHKYINQLNDNREHIYLLPQFKHQVKDATVYHNGEFYIGLDQLQAGKAINILFQVMEGTTDPLVPKPPDHIHWSYLSNNQWLDFEKQEISDSTLALLQSGIISFAIPIKATTSNTLLPPGYIWLKASIEKAAAPVCKLLSVDAQAAVATFKPNENADDFLNTALPAGAVTKLKTPDAAIKQIQQPYPSFGGRPKETEDQFYVRVSERLRHKGRAITIWDYEHLILEAFPEIYKVKCLNHTGVVKENNTTERTNELMPGNVLIITIPVLANRNDANPLKPYTRQDTLTKIEDFLRKRVSCFVSIQARQPLFEEVRLSFLLKLYNTYKDFEFYSHLLRNEITQFLTPWAYNSGADIAFGGKIYKSSLINFIEERYYVDYITNVQMFLRINGEESDDVEEIEASTARSILVSVPASQHEIKEMPLVNTGAIKECEEMDTASAIVR